MPSSVTLYSPSGAEYRTSSAVEITNLKARGYTEQKPGSAKSSK